jgi:hypothetical protein
VSEQVIKSFQHLYKLFKIYLSIAVLGGFIAVVYGFLAMYPTIPYYVTIIVILLFIFKKVVIDQRRTRLHAKLIAENRNIVWSPPPSAEYLLLLLLPKNIAVNLIGDLNERYQYITETNLKRRTGIFFANFWYWTQVLISIPPLLKWRLKSGLVFSNAVESDVPLKGVLLYQQDTEPKNILMLLIELLEGLKKLIVIAIVYLIMLFGFTKLLIQLFDLLIHTHL